MENETQSSPRADDSSEISAVSEAILDARDASPEAIRRGRMVVGIIIALAVAALVVIIITPPLSWKPPKKRAANYKLPEPAQVLQIGSEPMHEIRYAMPSGKHHIEVTQHSTYPNDKTTQVFVSADISFERPKRSKIPNEFSLKYHDVRVKVMDGDREMPMGSLGGMLSDIALYAELDTVRGLGTVLPAGNINPQVARVLYILTDAVRQIYAPLPESAVGTGSSWTAQGLKDKTGKWQDTRECNITFADGITDIQSVIHLGEMGSGTSHVQIRDKDVISGELKITRSGSIETGSAEHQEISVSWKIVD